MNESFAELFEESLKELDMQPGSIVTGTVVAVDGDFVVVNAGLKSEGIIPRGQFLDDEGKLSIEVGDQVKVALVALEDGSGETQLSREKAKRAEAWEVLEKAIENDEIITGRITGKVRGGFTVDVNSISAFLPGSLVDIRPLRDTSHIENKELEFKLVKLDAKRNNIVVSRRAVLETAYNEEREKLLASLNEGMTVKGVVKNLTDYGAFIDLGGVDGLLHITDIAWKRVKHPSELLSIGDEIDVKVLRYDRDKSRVSLGMKQLTPDPWDEFKAAHPVGTKVTAKVTNIADYGCFAEIQEGIEGLVHVSEMDWTNKNVHPSKVVQLGDQIEVMILDIDEQRRRISLGMKQCQANPWDAFAERYTKGTEITGVIKSITDFGVFIGLDGGIDGLVHLSDLSWDEDGNEAVKAYKKGDTVSAVVLAVDSERERISLGIKQLGSDPFSEYTASNAKGAVVQGKIAQVEPKQLVVTLAEGVEGTVKVQEASFERVDDLTHMFSVGADIEVMVVNIDRRTRSIALSVKQVEKRQEKQALDAIKHQQVESEGPTTIGDLIRAQLEKK
ncbi:30S ribosomal protein S1 [Amphritea pacifica]|uniref:30S ribosomal protein S1 n=1 Tax=Amphritea pacifica TaxID=2811233 RepID=A0ABS2W8V9_9GAMM|nr:30S ribosomal protein S1 [Amphritea pacifica]MBN0988171.1 30S ribosomal protein S1 [Amphritea pacifica]MBN1007614.1 30S ribosomal protein S1 [Amphritea pacifica]